jgi:hypothetical protein
MRLEKLKKMKDVMPHNMLIAEYKIGKACFKTLKIIPPTTNMKLTF